MSEDEEKIIRQVKTMLENVTPFDMPPSRYNALETMVNLIEKQQKEIEELEEKVKRFNDELDLDYVDNNFIPKDKIREKIKEYEEEFDMGERWYTKNYIIEILKELLGE